jgi:HPt (histidine-containing phosphotransfer) domain-containing protein
MTQIALSDEQLKAMLAGIWEKSLPVLKQRVEVLEQAVAALADGTLAEPLREMANGEAHRLAGLLGTFGYPEGTDAARELELAFQSPEKPDDASAAPHSAQDTPRLRDAVVLLRKIVGE